jgi:hypothetical protein
MLFKSAAPSILVLTPFVVPFSRRVAPIKAYLFSAETTIASKVFCAFVIVAKATSKRVSVFFIILLFYGLQI